jgi:membrane protease YdiL (CAAX protease family)/uncharacterized RDD family membrane protein YckC
VSDGFVHGGRTYAYAGFGRRLGAGLLDSVVWFLGISFFVPSAAFEGAGGAILSLLILTAWFNYFAICEWRWGQTIGKNMLGIRVMPLAGGRLRWNAAAVRNILRLVDLPLTLVMVLPLMVQRSPRRQRLGDRAANTIVVREQEGETTEVAAPPAPTSASPAPTSADLFADATGALAAAAPTRPRQEPEEEPAPSPAVEATPEPETKSPGAPGALPYADWPVSRTIWGVVAGLLLGGVFLPIPVLIADPDLDTYAGLIAAQAVLAGTLIGMSLYVAGAGESLRPALAKLGLRRFEPSALGWAALAYFGYLVAIAIYASLVVEPDQDDIARDLGLDSETIAAAFSVLLIAIVAPISEELFFRGLLYGGLRRRMAPVLAALISGLIFGGLHATTGLTAVPPLVILGFVLALLYERTGSLWPPILVHFVNNSLALALSA